MFVGNVDPEKLRPLVTRYIASLPTSPGPDTWQDDGVRPPDGVVERTIAGGIEDRSRISLIFSAPYAPGEANRAALSALAGIAGARLNTALRERLGGCSGVAALELSGRADVVDSMLEAIPRFTRLGMFGAKRESLTIDYYVNVHRKGLEMVSGVLDPFAALTRQSERALEDIARASRLLHVSARADECRVAMAAAGPWSGSGDAPA